MVAAVAHAPPQAVFDTFLAHSALSKKDGRRTKEPIIVKCLDHGHLSVFTCDVNRWRYHDKGVVDVDEVGPFPKQQSSNLASRVRCPDDLFRQRETLEA